MIAHQHIGLHPPARADASLTERLQKPPPIRIVLENRLAPIPAVENVVHSSLKFNSGFAGHNPASLYPISNPDKSEILKLTLMALN